MQKLGEYWTLSGTVRRKFHIVHIGTSYKYAVCIVNSFCHFKILVKLFDHPRVEGSSEGEVLEVTVPNNRFAGTVCLSEDGRLAVEPDGCRDVKFLLAKQGSEALMNVYRQHSATLGQRVQVISAMGSFTGTAKAVTDSGSLIVTDDDGQDREVLAADVSVRGLMGYA